MSPHVPSLFLALARLQEEKIFVRKLFKKGGKPSAFVFLKNTQLFECQSISY